MNMTQKDYETRVSRLADGTSPDPDDDRRVVKHYESQGYAHKEPVQPVDEPVKQEPSRPRGRRV